MMMADYYFWTLVGCMLITAVGIVCYPLQASKTVAFILSAIIVTVSLFIYSRIGDYGGVQRYWQIQTESAQVKAALARVKNPQQLIVQLQQHLKQDPTSAEGWFLLGKLYIDTGQVDLANNALNRAYRLSPHNDVYVLAYVQADFFAHGRRLTPEDVALLAPILKHDPNNVNVINLFAIDAYLQHHYQTAVSYWERLLAIFPPDSDDSKAVLQMIAKAQGKGV